MNIDQVLQTFIAESRELLEDMENALLAIEKMEKSEAVNAIFRAAHTIKGSAGLFGLNRVVAFTHVVESVLDNVRSGEIGLSDELVALLLSCCDHMGSLIDGVERGELNINEGTTQADASLIEHLRRYLSPNANARLAVPEAVSDAKNVERVGSGSADVDNWHISLRFGTEVMKNGMDPLSFIRYLGNLGKIVGMVTLYDGIPSPSEMDPESCYLGFEITFKSDADKAAIENVFEFVRDDCQIRILPPNSRISEYIRLIQALPAETVRLGEILVRCGILTARELEDALSAQSNTGVTQPIGAILVEKGIVQPAIVEAALAKQQHVKDTKAQESRSIRVDADKLDRLINLVGELIINAASANLLARRARIPELQDCTSMLSDLVEEVRDSTLQLRMVKIGTTFNRFQRVVYDVSREIGKDIDLVIKGEDTELDKTVVEKITDPLTHLVRNSIDHGIEPADVRAANGKPVKGKVTLNAYHDSGSIVIEVSDDGGGLKRDKILAKAIERGLIEPGQELSDREIYDLIFSPGFSTAEQITNLSGRGVGMDVVKGNITALRGSIEIDSREGIGTTTTIRLPLTLAIIDGFLVGLGKSMFVVPLDMIEECVEFPEELERDYVNLRGHVLPLVRLRTLFEIKGAVSPRQNVIVVKCNGKKAGLVVDTLFGEFQTVIKPLGKMFSQIKCISGSTILGSGEVALIMDVPSVMKLARQRESAIVA